jgi:ABC-type branched-subunit amino acid transport system ATPase component
MLRVRSLSRNFGGYAAIADLDLAVERGTIHAVIGPNGAGKTTLFNVITGVLPPSAGHVLFDDVELTGAPPHRITTAGIARTFQSIRLFKEMTALENVMLGRHCRTRGGFARALLRVPGRLGAEDALTRHRAEELLALVALGPRAGVAAGALTLVEQRRLEMARALATEPRLLLLDEPAAGMHPVEIEQANRLIQQIRATGVTVLLTEHHMSLVMTISDAVTVLNHGRKIAEGAPAAVQRHPDVIAAYLGAGT